MGRRKKLSTSSWVLIISLLIFGAYFLYGSFRINLAQIDAKNYSVAPFCDHANGCREKIRARVLKSQTVDISITVATGKYGTGYRKTDKFVYQVVLQSESNKRYEVTIVPNMKMDTSLFGVSNVYFPVHQDGNTFDYFAEHSFPVDAILDVETWSDRITLIYSKYVNSPESNSTSALFNPLSVPPAEGMEKSESATIYAIPVTTNPYVAYKIMQNDFEQSLVLFAIMPVLFIVWKLLSIKRKQ